jgi:hypothetical protein
MEYREKRKPVMKAYQKRLNETGSVAMTLYAGRVKAARLALLHQVSVDGHCAWKDPETGQFSCTVNAAMCDVDHMDPDTILSDGLRRKQKSFGHTTTLPAIQKEMERNRASDGTLLLQALCPNHHALKQRKETRQSPGRRERIQAVDNIKISIARCQFEACESPDFVCDSEKVAPAFHFDHLFTVRDEDVPPDAKKKCPVGTLVATSKSLDEIRTEIAKCRLVHANCHRRITTLQREQGRLGRKKIRE